MLARDVVAQRIKAARILRGVHQADLGKLFKEDGLGKEDVGRLEREDIDLRRSHIDALVRHLHVPEWWFTDEELDLPATLGASPDEGIARVEAAIIELRDQVERLGTTIRTQQQGLERAAQAAQDLAGRSGKREEKRGAN